MFAIISTIQDCTTELAALEAIYNTNGGDAWTGATNWMSDESMCKWAGVTCNGADVVIGLDLSSFGLTGTLSTEI